MVGGIEIDYPFWVLAGENDTIFFVCREKYELIVDNNSCTFFYFLFRFFFFCSYLSLRYFLLYVHSHHNGNKKCLLFFVLIFLLICLYFERISVFTFSLFLVKKNMRVKWIQWLSSNFFIQIIACNLTPEHDTIGNRFKKNYQISQLFKYNKFAFTKNMNIFKMSYLEILQICSMNIFKVRFFKV